MKVLIGVDGSNGSFEAVRQATSLLAPGRDVAALYYSPPTVRLSGPGNVEPEIVANASRQLTAAVFQQARGQAPAAMRQALQEIVGDQAPRAGLVAAATAFGADLIAVGARGVGPLERLLLGSVSRSVLHQSEKPVLIARTRPRDSARPLRVLAAIDDAASAKPVLKLTRELSWPEGTQARLLAVIDPMFAGEIPDWLEPTARDEFTQSIAAGYAREHEKERLAKLAELEAMRGSLSGPFSSAEVEVAEGYPSEQILAALARYEIDIAILGARGLSAIARLVLGSTSEKIVAHAPCSVLVVPAPAE